ncbi:hypothetical protein [Methylopila musalis]|uniref:hypothetical protein n=1 Tax=Methylopila musalis TaxID=1134781 RepID=UPI00366EA312
MERDVYVAFDIVAGAFTSTFNRNLENRDHPSDQQGDAKNIARLSDRIRRGDGLRVSRMKDDRHGPL